MLRRYQDSDTEDARHARETILDALIRVEAKLSAGDLEPLLKRHRTPAFILMARNPRANRRALFELRHALVVLQQHRIDGLRRVPVVGSSGGGRGIRGGMFLKEVHGHGGTPG